MLLLKERMQNYIALFFCQTFFERKIHSIIISFNRYGSIHRGLPRSSFPRRRESRKNRWIPGQARNDGLRAAGSCFSVVSISVYRILSGIFELLYKTAPIYLFFHMPV